MGGINCLGDIIMKYKVIYIIVLILVFSTNVLTAAQVQPCFSCHSSMENGFIIREFEPGGSIYSFISFACPEYEKVIKEKFYTEELIMKSEELLKKLKDRDFYTLPLEKAIPVAVQKYMEINSGKINSSDEYSKKNKKLRFELNKTYMKLAGYDFAFKGRHVFSVTLLVLIFLFTFSIIGWKKAHNKKSTDMNKYLDEQYAKEQEISETN